MELGEVLRALAGKDHLTKGEFLVLVLAALVESALLSITVVLTFLASPRLETLIALLAASLVFIPLHELFHAAAARLLGSRVAVKPLRRYFSVMALFLDPLPLWRAALVYLAPLLATPLLLLTQLPGLPSPFTALLWAAMATGDAVALLAILAERPRAVVCTPDGRVLPIR
jgi:hypothetical protein